MALGDYNPYPNEQSELTAGSASDWTQPAAPRAPAAEAPGLDVLGYHFGDNEPVGRGVQTGLSNMVVGLTGAVHSTLDGIDPGGHWKFGIDPWQDGEYKPELYTLNDVRTQNDAISNAARQNAQRLAPRPEDGIASNVIQGLVGAVTEVTAGTILTRSPTGGLAIASATEGYSTYRDVLDQTGDPVLAQKAGELTAGTFAAGMSIPYAAPLKYLNFASTTAKVAAQMAVGATVNTALGGFDRFATHKLLDDAGFHQMAEQYKVADGQAMLVDAALGMAFGAHQHMTRVGEAHVQEAIKKLPEALNELQRAQDEKTTGALLASRLMHVDSTKMGIGIPADAAAEEAHRMALYESIAALHAGEPVDVGDTGVTDANFVARPDENYNDIIKQEFERAGVFGAMGDLDHTMGELAKRRGETTPESPWVAETALALPTDSTDTLRGNAASTESAGSPELTLTAPETPRAVAKAEARRALDLFGEDTSGKQLLHDYAKAKDEARSPNRDAPIETGNPNDLFSQARRQVDIEQALVEKPLKEPVVAALTERPKMRVTRDVRPQPEVLYKPRGQKEPRDARVDSLLEFLARHPEGLDSKEAEAHGIDRADMHLPEAKVGIKRAFRKGGMSFDRAAEMLHEAGYPVVDENGKYNPNTLLDMLDRELRGDKVFSDQNPTGGGDRMLQEHQDAAELLAMHEAMIAQHKAEASGLYEGAVNCFLRNA